MYTASIYSIFNSISNTVYIGQTLRDPNQRWREHKYSFSSSKIGMNSHLKASYAKYGKEAFTFTVIEFKSFALLTEAKLWANLQEEANITKQKELGIELYNIRPSCISNAGCSRSDALKQQVSLQCSIALKGRVFTKEHKKNISVAKKGKSTTKGIKRKDVIWNKSKKMTEAYKTRHQGEKNSQAIFTLSQVTALRSWYASLDPKPSFKTIAIKYDTVPSVIYNIIKGKTYQEPL